MDEVEVKVLVKEEVSVAEKSVNVDTPIMLFVDSISAMAIMVIFIVSLISIIVVL